MEIFKKCQRNEKHACRQAKKLSLQSHKINIQITKASDHNNLNDFFLRTTFHWPVEETLRVLVFNCLYKFTELHSRNHNTPQNKFSIRWWLCNCISHLSSFLPEHCSRHLFDLKWKLDTVPHIFTWNWRCNIAALRCDFRIWKLYIFS